MRSVLRLRLQRSRDDIFNPLVTDLARGAASRFIVQAIQTMLCKALAPCPNGLAGRANRVGDLAIVQALRGEQDNLRPLGFPACHLAASNETFEKTALVQVRLIAIDFLALLIPLIPRITSRMKRITLRNSWLEISKTGH